jgi:hypothetical protein
VRGGANNAGAVGSLELAREALENASKAKTSRL